MTITQNGSAARAEAPKRMMTTEEAQVFYGLLRELAVARHANGVVQKLDGLHHYALDGTMNPVVTTDYEAGYEAAWLLEWAMTERVPHRLPLVAVVDLYVSWAKHRIQSRSVGDHK